jgi:hypothetical protein
VTLAVYAGLIEPEMGQLREDLGDRDAQPGGAVASVDHG